MKTNIATDNLQSQRLLRCGVSADTADMCWYIESGEINIEKLRLDTELIGCSYDGPKRHYEYVPAWSLSRLLELLPKTIDEYHHRKYTSKFKYSHTFHDAPWHITYSGDGIVANEYFFDKSPIETCVKAIEWLSENNYKLNNL